MSLVDRIVTGLRAPAPGLRQPPISTNGHAPPRVRSSQPTVAVYRYGKPTWPEYTLRRGVQFYDQVVVAFACTNIIADAAATATVRVYDESQDDEELPEHPLRLLMRHPNHYMSESEWINAMVKTAAVTGYAVSEIERAAAGRPVALHPLRPDWLAPIPRRDNLMDWQYQVPGGETVILAAEDVVDWTYQGGPISPQFGVTPMVAACRELGITLELTDFIKAFFDSGAVPQIGLIPDENSELDQAEADVIKEKFRAAAGTPWEPIVMQAIKDVKRLGFDLNEMAYKDLRALTSTEICTAFRVPPVMLGTLVGLENSPWSKYEEARKSFYEDTIVPLWGRLDGALSRSLLPEFETNPAISLEFDTSDVPALQEDNNDDWLHVTSPGVEKMLTVNDRRALVGFPPIAGGDVRILSMADIEVPATEEAVPIRSNGHALVGDGQSSMLGEGRVMTSDDEDAFVTTMYATLEAARNGALTSIAYPPIASGMPPAREIRARQGTQNKDTIIRLGNRFAPVLGRFWRAQGRRITSQIFGMAAADPMLELRVADPIDWDEEARQLFDVMRKLYVLSGKTAFSNASDHLGVDVSFDLANPNLGRVLDVLGTRVAGITATTRDQLATLVSESLAEGVTLAQLSERIQAQFDGYSAARAMTVSRTESQVAFNTASRLAYQESGLVETVELHDNPNHGDYGGDGDGLTCAERNQMLVNVSDVDKHILGAHPNCILAISPVLSTALGEG